MRLPALATTLLALTVSVSAVEAIDPTTLKASEYVVADAAGHLTLGGERIRFWGAIGGLPSTWAAIKAEDTPEQRAAKVAEAYRHNEALVQRLVDLGFNLNRTWHKVREDYVPGDGSRADIIDHFYATMKQRGLHLWHAGINDFGKITAADAGIIEDAASAKPWAEAMTAWGKDGVDVWNIVRKWDRRFEAMAIKRRAEIATHVNHHTGLRYADDPVFAAWELSNEEWWISKMVGGTFRGLPAYFQQTLQDRWITFLKTRYPDEATLLKRWGKLLPGESLATGSVQILPLAGEQDLSTVAVDETARKALIAAAEAGKGQKWKRSDFARERGEDVLAFFSDLHLSSKRREAEAFKPLGRSTKACVLAWDTGIGYEIQSQWMHQNSDVSVHDAYVNGWGDVRKAPETFADAQAEWMFRSENEAVKANVGPWNCWLIKPPGIAQGVPWLEHNKVPGKPYLAYETQIQQPAKYRADFPYRLASLAAIQDWDGVCWHYFAPPSDAADPQRWVEPMDITVGGHPQGYHYTFDEVQMASMRAAAIIWRSGLLKPAASPTTFIYGRKSLQDPDSMSYGRSYGLRGLDMLQTVYQYGARLIIDPTREDNEVRGPVVRIEDRFTHNPYTPTPEIRIDWKLGNIVFDAPGAAVFTGFLPKVGGKHAFANGVTLSDIAINNPAGIYDPVTADEGYVSFALHSEDGKPLAQCKSAALVLVSTSFNTGFSLAKSDFEIAGDTANPLYAKAGDGRQGGGLPVLTARVAGTVACKAIDGMGYTIYDWTMQPIGEGTVAGGTLRVPNDKPVFVIRLKR